ncbi:putative HLH DNA binding protein (Penr2) [Aspergillus ruber CBS 135680]|uniref:Putative HLH DNA binding protein n=1 Tax=Aspergillus ruber (strain CBS 135680) TaxID=1388766 RepID=A0A017S844_ASPRC|nr:putative HLH DNA binding protein [Aspergillus ruber CBS 135680]EYE93102.1 putative HLH DNA binding protein [Aspergillus ruber CBS 135680]
MSEPSMPPSDNIANKRKRESTDSAGPEPQRNRSSNASNGSIQSSDQSNFQQNSLGSYDHNLPNTNDHGIPNSSSELNIDQQILQHVGTQNGISDDSALTAKAALAAHTPQNKYPAPPDAPFDTNNLTHGLSFGDDIGQGIGGSHNHNSTAAAVYAAREAQSMNSKPSVGSPEWHQVRKNNHKEVERRRREAINEGINQIARLVPNCDKNKGAILQRAIEYIHQLIDEKRTIQERWEQSNMTTHHAINEVSAQNSKLKIEVNRRGEIAQKWIHRCQDAGLQFEDYNESDELKPLEVDQGQG